MTEKNHYGDAAQTCGMRAKLAQIIEEAWRDGHSQYLHADGGLSWEQKSGVYLEALDDALASQPPAAPVETDAVRHAFEAGFSAYFGPQGPEEVDGFLRDQAAAWREYASATPLARSSADIERERDEARQLVIEANNSLYGSQGYFHSLNGGAFDKYHLARGIEDLKARLRDLPQPVEVPADEDHPDCATPREVELYHALMGLASAVATRTNGPQKNWTQGGIKIWPVVEKALRLSSAVPRPKLGTEP